MPLRDKGFTLIEVIIASSIFTIVMTLVLITISGSFRSFHKAQTILTKEQGQRLCLYRMSKELASFARIKFPQVRFKGEQESFFLSSPKRTA